MISLVLAASFALVENGRPMASFELATTNESAAADVELFNEHLREVTGAALPVGGAAANKICVSLERPADISRRFEWSIRFPDERRMEIVATRRSLMAALVSLLEEGCDARFLGSERCMFQFEPRSDAAVDVRDRRSAPHGYTLSRNVFRVPGHRRELGLQEDGEFRYTHGIPVYAFPKEKYNKEGWPAAIMPTRKDGTKLVRPEGNPFVGWQPCYSSPETARIATENILAYLRAHPEETSITLGVNDNRGYCECARCRELNARGEPALFTNNPMTTSESYYTFVNLVADAVTREFPAVRIGLLAYTGTIMPPTFKVASNVVPMMTFDLGAAAVDPEVVAKQEDVIRRWGQMVRETGTWSYDWGRGYLLPRVDADAHAHRIKFLYENGGRAYFGEAMLDALEGPKLYLISKLLADVDLDAEKVIDEWYVRYAGKAAERPLREIYRRTREYARSPRMQRTSFWRQRGYIYVQPTPKRQVEQLAAITPGFTKELLDLAREVLAAAGTPGERRRAEVLVRHFELLDVCAAFIGSAHCSPESTRPAGAAGAAAMLDELSDRAEELMAEFARAKAYFLDPDFDNPDYYRGSYVPLDLRALFIEPLVSAGSHYADPRVAEAFRRLGDCKAIPDDIRSDVKAVAASMAERRNVFGNQGFANPIDKSRVKTALPYEVTGEMLCNGAKTLCLRPGDPVGGDPNPWDIAQKDVAAFHLFQDVEPGYYSASAKVWTDAQGPCGADFVLWRQSGGNANDWDSFRATELPRGKWRKLNGFCAVDSSSDGICFVVRLKGFKPGEKAYVGDIRLVKVAPMQDTRHGELRIGSFMLAGGSALEKVGRSRLLVCRKKPEVLTSFARAQVPRGGGIRVKDGEKLFLKVRCRSLDAEHPAVLCGKFSEKSKGGYHVVGAAPFWNRRLPAEFTEVTGSLDASALDKDVRRHKMLLNLFLQKGSGPVAVESVEWKVLSVNQEEK